MYLSFRICKYHVFTRCNSFEPFPLILAVGVDKELKDCDTTSPKHLRTKVTPDLHLKYGNQRTNGHVNAHLISGPTVIANFNIVLKWVLVN